MSILNRLLQEDMRFGLASFCYGSSIASMSQLSKDLHALVVSEGRLPICELSLDFIPSEDPVLDSARTLSRTRTLSWTRPGPFPGPGPDPDLARTPSRTWPGPVPDLARARPGPGPDPVPAQAHAPIGSNRAL